MAFDQSTILDVRAARVDAELAVSWDSSSPAGTAFQVYVDRVLSWHGTARRCVLPHPRSVARVEVGTVLPAEASADLSGSLPSPAGGGQRLTLRWAGGTYLDPSIASYRVFVWPSGGSMPATPASVVPAYLAGVVTDGFGVGGFGSGGFGHAAASYEWTSAPLAAGTWAYAVVPVDSAGNAGTSSTGTATVSGPPRPPARGAGDARLAYAYRFGVAGGFGTGGFGVGGFGTGSGFGAGGFGVGGFGVGVGDGLPYLTLSWLASPGY